MPLIIGRKYWYAFGVTPEGRNVLLGPFDSQVEAGNSSHELGKVKIFPLGTSDRNRATGIVKASLMKRQAQSPDNILRPMRHRTDRGQTGPKPPPPLDQSDPQTPLYDEV